MSKSRSMHASQPSRIYGYGAKPPLELQAVEAQMAAAAKYRDRLVEIERCRRRLVDQLLAEMSPRLAEVEEQIRWAKRDLELAREALKQEQGRQRKKVRPAHLVAPITAANALLKPLYVERKALRTALFAMPEWKTRSASIESGAKSACKEARRLCGAYWGTYLFVENSLRGIRSGAPPQYAERRGDGHIAAQIQKGIPVPDLFGGKHKRRKIIYVDPVAPEAWLPGGRHLRKTRVHIRIGSDGRKPIWTTVPIVLHRQLPEDAVVKWVHVLRRRIGTHCDWSVQFVLSRASGWAPKDRAASGAVGIDVGWRVRPGGLLRVAYWVGDDGREGELTLPDSAASREKEPRLWLAQMRKVEDIRSIRDRDFDLARARISSALGTLAAPPWLTEATKTLVRWKSEARLAALAVKWRDSRFAGDDAVYGMVEEWRKRDKHLLEYEANLRDQLLAARRNRYRVFAAEMRRSYRTISVEQMDLRKFHTKPKAEDPPEVKAAKKHVRDACLSSLVQFLKESFAVVKVRPEYTTQDCAECGAKRSCERSEDDALTQRCSRCAHLEDQDRNAARNILRGVANGTRSEVAVA